MLQSRIAWLDHDAEARERSIRVLAMFGERDTRDELGLGSIRDNLADLLFPGTSTIQTRLRYMFFVPWVYQQVESELARGALEADRVPARASDLEFRIVDALLDSDDQAGVFGVGSGRTLKRLPSSVYWAGLESWGIREVSLSQDRYVRSVAGLVGRRQAAQSLRLEVDGDAGGLGYRTWHAGLPEAPERFPAGISLSLTSEEAAFILDRVRECHPSSLLAHLFEGCLPAGVDYPWEHPDRSGFSDSQQELLDHAEKLAVLAHGSFLLYNLALSERREREDWVEHYEHRLDDWSASAQELPFAEWSLDELFGWTRAGSLRVSEGARTFLREWLAKVLECGSDGGRLRADEGARELIRLRESLLKKSRSRFNNPQALTQWSGKSGADRYNYRWATVSRFHRDLYAAFQRDGG
ncbi:hypothetical protein TVD_08165 [Thioalkalivibrio versutus]|uniref:Uncharacterized protein n=1 Tax=Thioalkalivibrio versutus TaxID=106634 RepID=A0A0G3G930_9GAMM|nr:DUF6361 family protein [Thioalkalivibrio versutus]AKJ95336.1 hypothetical protein TVD_08165 [Thioalkalivibrio versutus]